MSAQTDFSKPDNYAGLVHHYEQYIQGVDRLNAALNLELQTCHQSISQLSQQISRLTEQSNRDYQELAHQQAEVERFQQRADSLAWFEQSLGQLLQRMEARVLESREASRTQKDSVILEEDTIMDGLGSEPDQLFDSLRKSIVSSRFEFPDPSFQQLMGRLLMLFEVLLARESTHRNVNQREEVDVLISKIMELEAEKNQLAARTSETEKDLVECRSALIGLEEKLHESQDQSRYLRTELQHAERSAGELRQHLQELQNEEYEGMISDGDIEQREDLMQRLQEQYQQKEQLYEFIAELKATVEELNRSIDRNKQQSTKNKDRAELARLQVDLSKVKKHNSELSQTLLKEVKRSNEIETEVASLKKDKQRDQKEILKANQLLQEQKLLLENALKQVQKLRSQQQSAVVASDLLNMSDQGRYYRPAVKLSAKSPDLSATNPEKENSSDRAGSPTLDASRWVRLQERLQYRKHYTDSLNKNLSFKLLKLRN